MKDNAYEAAPALFGTAACMYIAAFLELDMAAQFGLVHPFPSDWSM
jgi:hypothetical protein